MSWLVGLAAKHWKTALVLILLSGAGLYAWWQHHEASKYHAQVISFRQAEHDATTQAKAEQKQADAKLVAQAKQEALQAHKAAARASQIAQAARSSESRAREKVDKIASHNANAKAWQDTPIPASVLQAIGGGL